MAATEIPSTKRRSLFNVITENLDKVGRNTFIHRIVYVGDHTAFVTDTGQGLRDAMKDNIRRCNEEYHDDELTGLFLYYQAYFVHMLEGSEEAITKHLRLFYEFNDEVKFNKRAKVLATFHHIGQRFFEKWMTITGRPPTLLAKLNPNCLIDELSRHCVMCLRKVYNLCLHLRKCMEDEESPALSMAQLNRATENAPELLPEFALLEFFLQTKTLFDLRAYGTLYERNDHKPFYSELVWPVPSDFVPYNVFEHDLNEDI